MLYRNDCTEKVIQGNSVQENNVQKIIQGNAVQRILYWRCCTEMLHGKILYRKRLHRECCTENAAQEKVV